MHRRLTNLLIIFLLVIVSGCGFHLRGSTTLDQSLQTLYIQGVNLRQGVGLELKQGLKRNGVNVLTDYQQNTAVLTVLNNEFEKRVLSVGSDARVSEYQLYGSLTYKLTDADNHVLIKAEKIEATRDYQFQQGQVLGSEQEEAQLQHTINQELVQQLLRRLAHVK